jgi:hypothetical protein
MRYARTTAVLVVLALWLALGPWVLLSAAAAFSVPRVRAWLRPSRRAALALVAVSLTALVVLVPDGWLPIPPGGGALVTPAYVGRPAVAVPLRVDLPREPGLAAADPGAWPGPLGESPNVDTAWFGAESCGPTGVVARDRLVALCTDRRGPLLQVTDPETLRPLARKLLPARPEGSAARCGADAFYVDERDRAVVATTDQRVLAVATADAEGDADLTTVASSDVSGRLPAGDCLVAVAPDAGGRTWFATDRGRVGSIDTAGRVRVVDLEEPVANPLAVDREGVYVVTADALYRLHEGADGPAVDWRTSYDRGSGTKPGQRSQGSGSTPTLLPGGLVAVTDNAEPRMHVVVLRRGNGARVCAQAVFGADEGATESGLVAVGTATGPGVVVTNNHGSGGALSTLWGRVTEPGITRVDVRGGDCTVAWTSEAVVPAAGPRLSRATGLLYAVTKRRSWWGAASWYLSGLDARTGRTVFSVRTGLGAAFDSRDAEPVLTRDGSAYVATVAGWVRVRDRAPGDQG